MGFAARLRQERLRRHLSQETLAEALGVSARTISRWEQGKGIPQAILRVQLSRYFEILPEAFFAESETLSSLVQADAEEPGEAFSLATPALPEHEHEHEHASGDHAAATAISQDAKVSGRSTSRRLFQRRSILLFGLVVLAVGESFAVFLALAALSAPAPQGPRLTPALAASPTVLPPASIRSDAVTNAAGTPAASNNRGTYICWGTNVHLPAQCMDLLDNRFSANQPISLWSSQSGHGLGWSISSQGKVTSTWPFTVSSLNTRYRGAMVASFEKTTGNGHNGCIGLNSNAGLAWERCGRADTYWVISRYGYLVNVSHSSSAGTPTAAGVCDSSNGGSISLGFENKPAQCLGSWTLI